MSIFICALIAVFGLAGTTLSAEQSVVVPVEPRDTPAGAAEHSAPREDATFAYWQRVIDEVREHADAGAMHVLAPVPAIFSADGTTLVALAERLGAAGASEAAATTALRWLAELQTDGAGHAARELARARVLAGRGHVAAALDVVDRLTMATSNSAGALRLRAQLLGADGQYAESLLAYDRYLALAPDDAQARREQARVAGWAQQFARARRLYDDIDRRHPGDRAAHAEAEAKRLFFATRWREAEEAYQRWLVLEPTNTEAAFEYAETLAAQGRVIEARAVLDQLVSLSRSHTRAQQARRTIDERAHPSAGVIAHYASMEGYGGYRSLAWSETAGLVSIPLTDDARHRLDVGASALTFSNRALHLPAYAASVRTATTQRWGVLQAAGALVRGARDLSYWQGRAQADLSVRHDVQLQLAIDRSPMLENLATVRDGVTSWGPSMAVAFATPDTEVAASARAGWVASNLEKAAAASVRRRVRRGTSEIWALAGAHHNAWRHPDVRFYSPLALSRLDAGVEWTRWLHPPRFRADRRSLWSVRYLAGADSDGEIYHQPGGRVSIEHRRVALDAEVSAVISPVYHSLTFHLGVRVGG